MGTQIGDRYCSVNLTWKNSKSHELFKLFQKVYTKQCQLINKNKTKLLLNTCIYHICMHYSPIWCLQINRWTLSVKGISLQFNTDPMSQLGNFSYKICMMTTPNGLNYLKSICILQFHLFYVKLPLQYHY